MKTLGLYLHVPFCRQKCVYCDFYSLARGEYLFPAYLSAMGRELSRWGPRAAGYTVDTVYLGGGTPTLLGEDVLLSLLELVKKHFSLAPGAEITLEGNPESSTYEKLRTVRRAGFNRLSLGVQSAQEGELRALGRIHTFSQAEKAAADARRAGFENLSLDLMYGLPGQTIALWEDTLFRCLELRPNHLSCYGLKVEPHTPLWGQVGRGEVELPGDDRQADLYLCAAETLERAGYRQYEISNFARPGFESQHNRKYWDVRPYLGIGPGAHSDFGGRRFAYAQDLAAFLGERPPFSEDQAVEEEERIRERLMLGLRTDRGAPEDRRYDGYLQTLERRGFVQKDGKTWRLTPKGYLVSNQIIGEILDRI